MRRSDREVKEKEELLRIIEKCDVCRLAFHDGAYPYILPFNFGMREESGQVVFYFHGAAEGKKYDLIKKDNRAGFEMDCARRLAADPASGSCTMEYECVTGNGVVEILPDDKKKEALGILAAHYQREDFPFNWGFLPRTTVFKLTVNEMSGKRNCRTVLSDVK